MTNIPKARDSFATQTNYDLALQNKIKDIVKSGRKPTLLLHSCCAPCSSYVLKYLQNYFDITVFFYNSNLYPSQEYLKRQSEQIKLIGILNQECEQQKQIGFEDLVFHPTPIKIQTAPFEPQEFYEFVKGYESAFEGSPRCYLCFMLRLNKTAQVASQGKFEYFCTTLTVSPYKNAHWINEVGQIVGAKNNVEFLPSDFKKNDGYKKSIEYSKEYQLYRQDYCGCEFSLNAKIAQAEKQQKN